MNYQPGKWKKAPLDVQCNGYLFYSLVICSGSSLLVFTTCFCCTCSTFSHTFLSCYFCCFFWAGSSCLSWFCNPFSHLSFNCCRFMLLYFCRSHRFFFSI